MAEEFAFPSEDADEYLISLGRLTQGYRFMDVSLLEACRRYFQITLPAAVAAFGGMDPNRKMETIKRYLHECYRSPVVAPVVAWDRAEKAIKDLVARRNDIVHSAEYAEVGDRITYVRLGATRPIYERQVYDRHGAVSHYAPKQITNVAANLYRVCDQVSEALKEFDQSPPEDPGPKPSLQFRFDRDR